jgi:prolycopene isomerase
LTFNADRILKPKYDVIIIGAGPGGLTTASLLAKRGVEVLVVEQQGLPGGACTSFRREGRVYDCGAALIFGLGKDGYNVISTLANLLEEDLTVIPREKFFRLDFAGKSINFWKDLDKFIPELEKSFPEEKGEIKKLYDYLVKYYRRDIAGQNILTPPTEMSDQEKMGMLRNPLRVLRLQGLLKQSAEQFLGSHIKSQKLLNFYDKLCASYAYVNMKETPAIMALTMFTDNHIGGTHYVATSAQTYSNTLERAIERNGGTIIYKRKVKQILFEEDRVGGVLLADDTKIHAERVVSDATVWNLYNNLIPQDRVTQKQKKWANSLIPTYPAMVLYAAVSKSVFPPDINPVEYYIKDPEQIDMNDITLYIPSVDDRSLGPSDEHIITIFSPSPNAKWPHPWDSEYRSSDYLKQKDDQAELIISEIEKRIPGFTQAIKKLIVATPSTIERYTLKNGGCVGGPKQMIGQEILNRLHAVTEWSGLYACGDSTTMGMGMPAVTASGFGAANVILREMNKQEYRVEDVKRNYVNYVSSQPSLNIPDEIDGDPKNASLLARECQHCEDQPCRASCPANVDISGTIRRIEAKNYAGAARLIREMNPLPEVCGYLCESKELCEKYCVRTEFASKAVRIKDLHRWVVEYVGEEGWIKPVAVSNGKSVCVIGAGPAGLTCAHYLARLGYGVELLDGRGKPGGELRDLVEKGILDEGALERDLLGLMLPTISFRKDIAVATLDLMELSRKHAAVYISIKHEDSKTVEESRDNMPNVIIADKVYNIEESGYRISQAVADGRKAAEFIHKIAKW